MAQPQPRVTDFYSRRKRGIGAPQKTSKQRGESSQIFNATFCSSTVRDEFIQVIDEAAGLIDGECAAESSAKNELSGPRTPKRTSAGAALAPASTEHSEAKKNRAAEDSARLPGRTARRRKLALLDPTPPAESCSSPPAEPSDESRDGPPVGSAPVGSAPVGSAPVGSAPVGSAPVQRGVRKREREKESTKVHCDVASLKSRLQRIKKHAEEMDSTAAPVPHTDAPLHYRLSRAKELAAKAQRGPQSQTPAQNNAEQPAEQPAYQRYHSLAQAAPPGLSLPYAYKLLAEMFRSMDTVVAILYNRCETATFSKIQRGVQDMMHKHFEERHVGQIKCVFPEAYAFRQEKNVPTFNSSMKKGYQLTVEPLILPVEKEARPLLSASRLLDRRLTFHLNLVSIVKQHHKEFLSSLAPPLSVPDDKLTRWHPRFNVDAVPPVQASALPQAPHAERLATAQEVLDKARSLITPKMEMALVSLTLKQEDKAADDVESTSPKGPPPPPPPPPSAAAAAQVPSALRGVSQSLLERIRAKEAQKIQAAMTRAPGQEERLLMMSRLGELARILRSVFIAEKKAALIMEVACNRMVASYRSALSTGDMEKHLRLLAEVATDWLSIHPIRKDFYLKLNRNMELNLVLDKVSKRLAEEERLQVDASQS